MLDSIVVAIWIWIALVTMAMVLLHFVFRILESRLSALENHVHEQCEMLDQIWDHFEDLDGQNELPFNDGDLEP